MRRGTDPSRSDGRVRVLHKSLGFRPSPGYALTRSGTRSRNAGEGLAGRGRKRFTIAMVCIFVLGAGAGVAVAAADDKPAGPTNALPARTEAKHTLTLSGRPLDY